MFVFSLPLMVSINNIRLDVRLPDPWVPSEVLQGLSRPPSSEQPSVLPGGVFLGELVECENSSACLQDPPSGGLGNLQSCDLQFRNFKHSLIVEDCGYDHNHFVLLFFGIGMLDDLGDRDRIPSGVALAKASEHKTVELRVGSSGHESVQLDQQVVVEVRGGRRTNGVPVWHSSFSI